MDSGVDEGRVHELPVRRLVLPHHPGQVPAAHRRLRHVRRPPGLSVPGTAVIQGVPSVPGTWLGLLRFWMIHQVAIRPS